MYNTSRCMCHPILSHTSHTCIRAETTKQEATAVLLLRHYSLQWSYPYSKQYGIPERLWVNLILPSAFYSKHSSIHSTSVLLSQSHFPHGACKTTCSSIPPRGRVPPLVRRVPVRERAEDVAVPPEVTCRPWTSSYSKRLGQISGPS